MTYRNLDGSVVNKGLADVLKWKLGLSAPGEVREELLAEARTIDAAPLVENDGLLLRGASRAALTWIGHATFLAQIGGLSLLIDPVLSPRIFTIKRLVSPGLTLASMPRVDAALVTHNHRDHMDEASLLALARETRMVVPKGLGAWFVRRGFSAVHELGWWEHVDLGDARVTFVPSQHWSQRGPLDRNESLWGGYVIEDGTTRVYHSGDTAYFEGFTEIGRRAGRIDAAMLPIGAYEPRWFMRPQHMNPEDAVQAFRDLRADSFVAMHWGTFRLTDEPIGEPPIFTRAEFRRHALEGERLRIVSVGETLWL